MNRRDRWAIAFVAYFFLVIPASFVLVWISRSALVFLAALVFHAAVALFIAWRRGDL